MQSSRSEMRRRPFIAIVGACILLAGPAVADVQDDIVRQLQSMGFSQVEVSRTLLGRVRITAEGADGSREIIVNPMTGEILRDLWRRSGGNASDSALLSGAGQSGSARTVATGYQGSDDDNDDEGSDDSGSSAGGSSSGGSSENSGSDDKGSDNKGSADKGSDDKGSDNEGSDDTGSDDSDDSDDGGDDSSGGDDD